MKTTKKRSIVAFDWDNTLVDTHAKGLECTFRAVNALGLAIDRQTLARQFVPDYHQTYRRLGVPEERLAEIDALWLRFYEQEVETHLFRDVPAVLAELTRRRHPLAVVTTGERRRVGEEIRRLGLEGRFAAVICREDVARVKPEPDALRLVRRALGMRRPMVVVGDHEDDVRMAQAAGERALQIVRGGDAGGAGRIASLHELLDRLDDDGTAEPSLSGGEAR